MNLETFFEKFDLFADAPDAVAKMRELVLRLAFSGGLTGKRPSEASIAECWENRTIESISASISSGFACSRSHQMENGHVHLRTHNVSTLGTLNFDLLVRIDPKMVDPQKASIRAGDILFNNTNSQELVGKTSLVDRDYDYGFSNHITRIRLKDGIFPGFVVFYLTLLRNSGYFARLCTRWINQAAVNADTLKEQTIPLPPLAEQKRIVAKVDELMALCDRLETQQQEREAQASQLARASLARFADAPTPANLPFLFHSSFSIPPSDLRKSILTLAVQGKLVPQDPNDEPAENCLLRLGLTDTATSFNQADVRDEELPSAWAKVRFEDVAIVSGGVTLGRKLGERKTVTLPYLRVANVKRGEIDLAVIKDVSIGEDEIERYALRENDLLMTEGGDWDKVGRAAIWKAEIPICLHQNHVFRARMRSVEIEPFWFERYFNSPIGRSYFESASKQTTNLASINMRQVRNCPIPLPPLAEQRRIVAKVEQLMALVDVLETQLAASRETAATLLAAIVAELTGTPHNGKVSLPAPRRGRGRPPQS
jgi:type I restriction enzyme S subunit